MKKYIKILLIAILAVGSTACSDWLTLAPEDGVTREEFWQTKEHVNSAVIGCYSALLNGPVEKMFLWGELRADMVDNGLMIRSDFSQVIDGEISASNPIVDWGSFYSVINNCNTVLKFAPDVQKKDGTFSDKMLKEYEAEALTLRAMMYFYLVRSFKDVPLVLNASVTDDQNYSIAKTPGTEILDSLVRDLKIASANAPLSYGGNNAKNKSRITAYTAKTLLADIYLWQEKYAECNALCQEVIGSGRYSMIYVDKSYLQIIDAGAIKDTVTIPNESDAEKMFIQSYVEGASVESIFEIPFTTQKQNTFYGILSPSYTYLKSKDEVVEGGIFPDTRWTGAGRAATDIRGADCSYKVGVIWKYVGTNRSSTTRLSTNYTAPWIVYKYADVLLMKAEALNQLGLQASGQAAQTLYREAAATMDIVRSARNAVKTSEYVYSAAVDITGITLEKSILAERAREFAFEGKRWYDVLRYAKRNNYGDNNLQYLTELAISSASPDKQASLQAKYRDPKHNSHYWPIYDTEIETNKELKQNEFYAK